VSTAAVAEAPAPLGRSERRTDAGGAVEGQPSPEGYPVAWRPASSIPASRRDAAPVARLARRGAAASGGVGVAAEGIERGGRGPGPWGPMTVGPRSRARA
jgi:hypothetical protein